MEKDTGLTPIPSPRGEGDFSGGESICYMWVIEYISRFIANISTTVITNRKSPGRCALGLILDNPFGLSIVCDTLEKLRTCIPM